MIEASIEHSNWLPYDVVKKSAFGNATLEFKPYFTFEARAYRMQQFSTYNSSTNFIARVERICTNYGNRTVWHHLLIILFIDWFGNSFSSYVSLTVIHMNWKWQIDGWHTPLTLDHIHWIILITFKTVFRSFSAQIHSSQTRHHKNDKKREKKLCTNTYLHAQLIYSYRCFIFNFGIFIDKFD